MSTRSRIGIENPDGTITSIYCHNDGYLDGPHGVGFKLHTHFNNAALAKKIIALGDLSSLYPKLAPPRGSSHSFDNALKGVTVAYGRDRKETDCGAHTSADREDFRGRFEEFNYLYAADGWLVIREYGEDHEKVWRRLDLALVTERLDA